MLDHVGLAVADFARSKEFFKRALAPLGYQLVMEFDEAAGFGSEGKPDFWIGKGSAGGNSHIAFTATKRKIVDDFYKAAMSAGGRDNGKPGLRTQYHPNYYGAFVFDPEGNNVEAVCHTPE
ncbi:MAG TPA: VOC family protein [Candidatus Binataceae bacterium]|jgi:catechol 2,3-dioxygenase-like lactoylglutathione lyase family enzyme|nr:VOC family protein [Candidatus Binataceae bacterium]